MGKILIGIPMLYGPEHCRECLESVIYKKDVDVLVIDNGAEKRVKDMLLDYVHLPNFHIIINPENIYVNPAWNQIMQFFLKIDYKHLIIMNSDLIMHEDWDIVFRKRVSTVVLPVIVDNFYKVDVESQKGVFVFSGTPGVFITMNRKQVELVYPIPSEILVWFGDLWIFTILREKGHHTFIPESLLAKHYWSSTVSKVDGISEIIEKDKLAWEIVREKYLLPLLTK